MTKKQNCTECNKETTSGVFILTGYGWKYEFYCISCARAYLGKLAPMSLAKATLPQLNQLSYQYDTILQQNVKAIKNAGFTMDEVCVEFKRNLRERKP